ncbi:aminodeoxychorismate/anthranilate synthase component II [Flavobacterium sp.]|uniref:anthranilate synthase component II n=1 Tax=Flavobacterium sp. TaxID=239 RepID=UPI00260EE489|nr:aminodeoxychorismate/anthranilate synthase component II [Flavobacterium sp.]
MKEVLIIDNYDSFTYNLVHYLEELNCKVIVLRNDEFELDEIEKYQNIILSPGPGTPSESGLLMDVIKRYASTKKILGICLGLQAIGEVFGGSLLNLNSVFHGVSSTVSISVDDDTLFDSLPKTFTVGRYHSWVINPDDFPDDLEVTSLSEDGEIMSIRHKIFDVKGVQFHPESILTPHGKTILSNWIKD